MDEITQSIRAFGRVAATHELLRRGHSPDSIFAAVVAGRIVRPRKGWYTTPDVGDATIRALRVGGRLGCVHAAVHHGLWVPDSTGLHVVVPRRASRLRNPGNHRERLIEHPDDSLVVHWARAHIHGDRIAVSVAESIRQVFICRGPVAGFVLLESALNRQRLTPDAVDALIASLRSTDRPTASLATGLAESGTESLFTLQLMRIRLPFRQQVQIAGIGRVDFLIGDWLVIEIDSKEHHADPYADRRRDAELSTRGYRVLRFMYSQIVFEWPAVEAALRAAISRGDHRG